MQTCGAAGTATDPGKAFRLADRRVLVVDDSATQRRLVAARIKPLGYEVVQGSSVASNR